METFKSASSGGFTKLSDGTGENSKDVDDKHCEEVVWFKKGAGHKKGMSEGALSVVVTRTVDIQSEDLDEGYQVRSGEYVHYDANVGCAR